MWLDSFVQPSQTSCTSLHVQTLFQVLGEEVRVAGAGEHRVQRDLAGGAMVRVVVVAVLEEPRGGIDRDDGLGAHLADAADHGLADVVGVRELPVGDAQAPRARRGRGTPRRPPSRPAGSRRARRDPATDRSSPGRRSSGPAGAPHGPRRPTSPSCRRRRSRRRRDARRCRAPVRCGASVRRDPRTPRSGALIQEVADERADRARPSRPSGRDRSPSPPTRGRRCPGGSTACRRRTPPGTTPR